MLYQSLIAPLALLPPGELDETLIDTLTLNVSDAVKPTAWLAKLPICL